MTGGVGSGDIFRLPLDGVSTDSIQLDGKDYVAFDLEWKDTDDSRGYNLTIVYAAAFVDNQGNQKVLRMSDLTNSSLLCFEKHSFLYSNRWWYYLAVTML